MIIPRNATILYFLFNRNLWGLFIIIQDISRSNEVKFLLKTVGEHNEFLKKTILPVYFFLYLFIMDWLFYILNLLNVCTRKKD